MAYCDEIARMKSGEIKKLHQEYHDNHYGFRLEDDDELFGRLILEINQAGLSWTLMLKKLDNFRAAFNNFSVEKVARYGPEDIGRLLNDRGIVRNRRKIEAVIENARRLVEIRSEYGSFRQWLDLKGEECSDLDEWTRLFRKTFKFVGSEIVNEFLMSIDMLPGAHAEGCETGRKIASGRVAGEGRSRDRNRT